MTPERKPAGTSAGTATVIVCAFALERFDQTLACVQSLLAQVPSVPFIVVVVDHNEPLERKLREVLEPAAHVVPNHGPPGLSGARNAGIERATGDTIAFLDDDAVAPPAWLATLQAAFEDSDVLAVGGHAAPVWSGKPPDYFPDEFLWVVGCSYRGLPASGPVRNALGCNMAFRAHVLAEVGGFDPVIGQLGSGPLGRCDETELCIRLRRQFPRGNVVMVEGATIEHAVPHSRQRFAYFWRRCLYEGMAKALVRRLSDERALNTERRYVTRTLTSALGRDLRAAVLLREPRTALLRIGWTFVGLALAIVGFAAGTFYYAIRPPETRPPRPFGEAEDRLGPDVPTTPERPAEADASTASGG